MIGAQILNQLQLHAEHGAVLLRGDLVVVHVAAAVNGAEEVLAPRFDPLHRLADLHGDEAHQRLFGVDVQLAAEAAADFGRDHAQPVFRQAQHPATSVRSRCGICVEEYRVSDCLAGAPLRHHAARFHRGGDQALAGDALLDDHVGLGEGLLRRRRLPGG